MYRRLFRPLLGALLACTVVVGTACSAGSDSDTAGTAPSASEPAVTEPITTDTASTTAVVDADAVLDARGIVEALTADELAGRDNLTDASTAAQDLLIAQLSMFAEPAYPEREGSDGFLQPFAQGSNVLAVIPGGDLADEFVVLGAHYDHIGSDCSSSDPADDICNGATDNAAGVAVALTVARNLAAAGTPRRSVVIALWDAEEDGLIGSAFYSTDPLVPSVQTVAYVNFDIQGSALLPSIADRTLAVGAESGGPTMVDAVVRAAANSTLDTALFSVIFGQGRSDHVNFIAQGVPSVFFTDATSACYHTAQDDVATTDFDKLEQQVVTASALAIDLATTDTPPLFDATAPVATYDDVVNLLAFARPAEVDFGQFDPGVAAASTQLLADLQVIAEAGPDAFDDADVGTLLGGAAAFVDALTTGECNAPVSRP